MTPTPCFHIMKTNLRSIIYQAFAILSACACFSATQAATVLNVNFENNSAAGWTSYQSTNPSSVTLKEEKDGDGNTTNTYLGVTSNTGFRGTYHLLSPSVTLGENQSITVSFKLMFTAASTNVRLGLFAYAGGAQEGDSDNGYYVSVSNGGNSLSINRDGDVSNDPTSGSTNTITASSSTTASTAFAADTWYDASLTLTLLSTGMQVTANVGGASATGVRPSGNFDTFGMFYIGSGNNNARFAIDDVIVTTTATVVPESGMTAALISIGALGCVWSLRFFRNRK